MAALIEFDRCNREKGEQQMRTWMGISFTLATLAVGLPPPAQGQNIAKPAPPLVREVVQGMPRGEQQEVRVMTATLKPGDATPFQTHRFPVTVYVLEGEFTLEVEGRAPVKVKAGQAMVEPPEKKMTGYNRSGSENLRVVIFYVSDPDTPFLDPVKH
jgi:quercetin dioxygenase-like cupin family protein